MFFIKATFSSSEGIEEKKLFGSHFSKAEEGGKILSEMYVALEGKRWGEKQKLKRVARKNFLKSFFPLSSCSASVAKFLQHSADIHRFLLQFGHEDAFLGDFRLTFLSKFKLERHNREDRYIKSCSQVQIDSLFTCNFVYISILMSLMSSSCSLKPIIVSCFEWTSFSNSFIAISISAFMLICQFANFLMYFKGQKY